MSRSVVFVLLAASASALPLACSSGGTPASTRVPPARSDSTRAAAAASWTPKRTAGSWRYGVRSTTVVSLTTDTTTQHVESAAAYSITALGTQPPLAIQGRVDSMAVTANGRLVTMGEKRPYASFSAQLSPIGTLEDVRGADSTKCPNAVDPAVANVYSLFVPVPASVSIGSTWEDTVVTTTCRGDLPITTTSARHYTLDGTATWNGRNALRITRSTATAVRSDTTTGRAFGVVGQGSGTATLLVDPATATLFQSTGTAQAELTIGTARAKTVFHQQVADTTMLQP